MSQRPMELNDVMHEAFVQDMLLAVEHKLRKRKNQSKRGSSPVM